MQKQGPINASEICFKYFIYFTHYVKFHVQTLKIIIFEMLVFLVKMSLVSRTFSFARKEF